MGAGPPCGLTPDYDTTVSAKIGGILERILAGVEADLDQVEQRMQRIAAQYGWACVRLVPSKSFAKESPAG
jgi:hypothetical protein